MQADEEMRNLTPADLVDDMSVIHRKRVAEDEQRCSVPCLRLANAGKTLEVVMQICTVLNLGQLALAVTLSNEDGKQVIL